MRWPYCYTAVANCKTALTPLTCATCKDNYVLTAEGKCIYCGVGVKKCALNGAAAGPPTECAEGYYLVGTLCTACLGSAAVCAEGQTIGYEHIAILSCSEGFALSTYDFACYSCGANAVSCRVSGIDVVSSSVQCKDDFYNSDGTCTSCPAGANACSSKDGVVSITTCGPGFVAKADKSECLPCNVVGKIAAGAYSCTQSSDAVNKITACISDDPDAATNYVLTDNSGCVACPTGSLTCDYHRKALLCNINYGLVASTTVTHYCKLCPNNADDCSYDATGATATVNGCKDGYGVNTAGTGCVSCNLSGAAGADPKAKDCNIDANGVPTISTDCVSGWGVDDGTTCASCGANSLTCTLTGGAIDAGITCLDEYGTSADTKACVDCATAHAKSCTTTTTAGDTLATCLDGYYVDGTACTLCDGTQAKTCTGTGDTAITDCNSGYGLKTDGSAGITTCLACPSNGWYCSAANTLYDPAVLDAEIAGAQTCRSGYFPNMLLTACVSCQGNMANCEYAEGYPVTCKEGYTINSLTSATECCECQDGAATCNVNEDCTYAAESPIASCSDHYAINSDSTSCVECGSDAKTCSLNEDGEWAKDETCNEGFIITEDADGVTTCLDCDSQTNGAASCIYVTYSSCLEGYYLDDTTNVCKGCSGGTATCDSTGSLTCKQSYVLDASPATPVCKSCNTGYSAVKYCTYDGTTYTPTECWTQYFLETYTKNDGTSAKRCTPCNTHSNGNNVASCSQSAIVGGSPSMGNCIEGSYSTYTCVTGPANCLTPNTPKTCSICNPGYYLIPSTAVSSPNTCASCGSGVKTCTYNSATGAKTITECNEGYFKKVDTTSTSCVLCTANCKTCSSDTICSGCQNGYYLTSDSPPKCTSCGTGAKTCSAPSASGGSPTISACWDGYYLAENACSTCQETYCKNCPSNTCAECSAGFFLSNGKCYAGVTGCYTLNQIAKCSGCTIGYFWDEPTLACKACNILNCLHCGAETICSACATGFYLEGGNCTVCPFENLTNCVSCSGATKCDLCKDGYYWDTAAGMCINCSTGCKYCGEAASCYECQVGYFRDSTNLCTACTPGCNVCSNNVNCTVCADGYALNNETQACDKCHMKCLTCTSSHENACLNCTENATIVDMTIDEIPGTTCECVSGFSFDEALGKCVEGGSYIFCGILSLLVILLALI
jgi:hypothetical protein